MRIRKVTNIIKVTDVELKKNLYSAFHDMLRDALTDDLSYFEMDVNRLTDAMQTLQKSGFTELFKDGYTMMLLPGDDFDFVDEWFNSSVASTEELEVRIYDKDNVLIETVRHGDLSY